MVCENRGQHWLCDFRDGAEWGGTGDGRAICAPVPEALAAEACAGVTASVVDALRPRLCVHDDTTNRIDRVA